MALERPRDALNPDSQSRSQTEDGSWGTGADRPRSDPVHPFDPEDPVPLVVDAGRTGPGPSRLRSPSSGTSSIPRLRSLTAAPLGMTTSGAARNDSQHRRRFPAHPSA